MLIPVCRAISALLPGQIEVVLHDLATEKIAHIENGFSPRKAGDDSLTDIADYRSELRSDDTIGPYLKANSDGARLRTVSALLRDECGNPVALLCFNLRLKELEAARDVLAALTKLENTKPSDMLSHDWREVANMIIAATLRELKIAFNQMRRPERLIIVTRLLDADIFSSRGSAEYVAEALGISRANLYALIKQAKQQHAEQIQ